MGQLRPMIYWAYDLRPMIYCLSILVGMIEPHQKVALTSGLNEMAMIHMTTQVKTKEGEMTFGGCAGRTLFELSWQRMGRIWTWVGSTRKEVIFKGFSEIKRIGIQISSYNVVHLKLI